MWQLNCHPFLRLVRVQSSTLSTGQMLMTGSAGRRTAQIRLIVVCPYLLATIRGLLGVELHLRATWVSSWTLTMPYFPCPVVFILAVPVCKSICSNPV